MVLAKKCDWQTLVCTQFEHWTTKITWRKDEWKINRKALGASNTHEGRLTWPLLDQWLPSIKRSKFLFCLSIVFTNYQFKAIKSSSTKTHPRFARAHAYSSASCPQAAASAVAHKPGWHCSESVVSFYICATVACISTARRVTECSASQFASTGDWSASLES
jgi:hypothetical protein